MAETVARRACCTRCGRAQRACICRWIVPVDNAADVVILQHPLEAGQAKGSAGLLDLCLAHSRLLKGEAFDGDLLQALLYGNERAAAISPVLLYPPAPGAAPPVSPVPEEGRRLRLIVLDGTWRKSRKMLHLNPLLRQLPRLSLADVPASRYRIRKAHRPQQWSTFEAVCHALAQLERDAEKYAPLLAAFDGFVAQQAAFMRPLGAAGS